MYRSGIWNQQPGSESHRACSAIWCLGIIGWSLMEEHKRARLYVLCRHYSGSDHDPS